MIKILDLTLIKADLDIAVLNVDVDIAAERLVLINRYPIYVHSIVDVTSSKLFKIRVPLKYATTDKLLVMILDDDQEFNAVVADGVNAEVIKTSEF